MKPAYADLVKQSSLFNGVSEKGFSEITEKAVTRSVEEGGFFFLQEDQATHAYVLLEGRVKMIQISPNGQQIIMRIITPGQTFGGIALLKPKAGYPATAEVVEDSTAAAWNTHDLRKVAETEPSIPDNVMGLMHGYISELQERQKALVTARVEQRIARMLLKLAAQSGKKTNEGILIDFPLTRQDIAEMSGTTLYTVSRTLNEWDRDGLLKIGREKVVICDPHQLVVISDDLVE
ncbi:MAG: Crp/Fnr family transcriptional regulator [Anaerolineales bacterium]